MSDDHRVPVPEIVRERLRAANCADISARSGISDRSLTRIKSGTYPNILSTTLDTLVCHLRLVGQVDVMTGKEMSLP